MAICHFFLQGRCRYGERCWNEHPRDGRPHGQGRYQQPPPPQLPPAGSTKWASPGYSKSTTWTNRDNDKTSFGQFSGDRNRNLKPSASSGSFSTQNHYSALAPKDHTKDYAQDRQTDRDLTLYDDLLHDLDNWESSGQWKFSAYSTSKDTCNISGFGDISPEELRLECYASLEQGHLPNYVNSVQQLTSQWKGRVQELKNLNPASKSALINELNRPSANPAPTFGGLQKSGFGPSNPTTNSAVPSASAFSFKPDAMSTVPNAGSNSTVASAGAFASKPPVGFANKVSAASFSFAATTQPGVGASVFPGFGSATTAPSMGAFSNLTSGFGSGSTGTTVATGFGSSAGATGFGSSAGATGFGSSAGAPGFGSSAGAPGFGSSAGAPGFGSSAGAPGFGSSAGAPGFGSFAGAPGFGSSAGAPGFGSSAGAPGFGSTAGAPGFGSSAGATTTFGGAPTIVGAGASGTSGFGAQTTAVSDLFKAGVLSSAPTAPVFGQIPAASVTSTAAHASTPDAGSTNSLFTPKALLSAEDLLQFAAKRFSLGKIPLLPPPADLLNV
ncbi:nucleoporin NUP42 [Pseudophryne corroboree]|uniref:nucleoporin NUP42 n=1 Tax=Pseudophryne corroboree TaxID=495146 RepID=UPI003081EB86